MMTTIVQLLSSKLTGYDSFEAANKNKEETRKFTEEGIAQLATVPKIPKDFDFRNKELLESFIREDIGLLIQYCCTINRAVVTMHRL